MIITDTAEWTYALRDGFSEAVFELQPEGRIRLVGNEVDGPVRECVFAISYPVEVWDECASHMRALAAETALCHPLPVDEANFDAVFELDPSRRIRLTGNAVDRFTAVRYPMFGAMFSRPDISAAADAITAMTAHAREVQTNH